MHFSLASISDESWLACRGSVAPEILREARGKDSGAEVGRAEVLEHPRELRFVRTTSPGIPFFGQTWDRPADQPYCFGEWNFCYPSDYRSEGLPFTTAMMAFQGWPMSIYRLSPRTGERQGELPVAADGSFTIPKSARTIYFELVR